MRILLIAANTIYSSDVALLIRRALRELGCEVDTLDVAADLPLQERVRFVDPRDFDYRAFNRRVYRLAVESRPDVVFLYGSNWGLFPATILKIRRQLGSRFVLWEGNFYLWKWFQAESIMLYDCIFCIDSYLVPLLRTSPGHPNVHLLVGAADPLEHAPMDLSDRDRERYGADVCFIGTPHDNRVQLFESLRDFNMKLWGPGWKDTSLKQFACNEPVYGLKKSKIYNASKIVVNLQGPRFQINGVSVRVFEVSCCGAFAITEPKPDLPLYFECGEEITTFESAEDLRAKVEHFLHNEEERKVIAARARARVLAEHTYRHRAQTILEHLAR
jgi:spore maturation protein CgeB